MQYVTIVPNLLHVDQQLLNSWNVYLELFSAYILSSDFQEPQQGDILFQEPQLSDILLQLPEGFEEILYYY